MVRPLKLTPAEVDEVWVRWRAGQAVKVLSRQMRVNPSTVRDLLHRTGGIGPAPKRRWEGRLSLITSTLVEVIEPAPLVDPGSPSGAPEGGPPGAPVRESPR